MSSVVRLFVNVFGIYAAFLGWALLQEKLGTTPYADIHGGQPKTFRSVLFLNTVQSATCSLSALGYIFYLKPRQQSWFQALGLASASDRVHVHHPEKTHAANAFLSKMFTCSLLHSLGSPFAFAALKHIDYPTMILGKSCKLVPVMLMNMLLYRRKFATHKYAVVAMVTLGISIFTFSSDKARAAKSTAENSILGLCLLLVSLVIDGATNSTQDELFARFRISGSQMMFFMNLFSTCITLVGLVLPIPAIPVIYEQGTGTSELVQALAFIRSHPTVLRDILTFGVAGALGQLFIFDTLQHFGSLTLVTVTVTRKLFTMLLSVAVYGHKLNAAQWLGVATVFAAVGIEALHKRKGGLSKKVIEKEETKARIKAI